MKSCWKSECKDAQKGEKALIQYLKRNLVHAGCYSVSNVFCNQIRASHIFFYEWVIEGNRIKKSEEKISRTTMN